MPYLIQGVNDWQASFEKVFHASSLQVPWYAILGNHDYRGNCDAQVEYTKLSSRWKMPARYYKQSHVVASGITADLFYLDTNPMIKSYRGATTFGQHVGTQDEKAQLAWFKKELAASKAEWKLVFGHHPIYSGGDHGDSKDLIEMILPLLHEHKVQAYFNGHDHDLQHLEFAGHPTSFVLSGGGGAPLYELQQAAKPRGPFAQMVSGFTHLQLESNLMTIRHVGADGTVVHAFTKTPNGLVTILP